jgi:DNA-binding response OmpR family regulator
MITRNQTILLVDDELPARKRMCAILRKGGYRVVEARDYKEALGLYRRLREVIALLLIDVALPGNNGCELAKAALALDPAVQILFMSGPAGAEVCKFYGILATDVHFLEKPFRSSMLLTRVKYVLDSPDPQAGETAGAT